MDLDEATRRAVDVRKLYGELERRRAGRSWTLSDLMLGFVGDVGTLAKLVGAHDGVRPGPDDLRSAIEHEVNDCLWSILVIAHRLAIDIDESFDQAMEALHERVSKLLAETPDGD